MKDYLEREEEITAYLSEAMSAEARLAFEAEMQTDVALADRVALYRAQQKALARLNRHQQVREMFAVLEKEGMYDESPQPAPPRPAPFAWRVWLLWAIGLVLVGVLGLYIYTFLILKPDSNESPRIQQDLGIPKTNQPTAGGETPTSLPENSTLIQPYPLGEALAYAKREIAQYPGVVFEKESDIRGMESKLDSARLAATQKDYITAEKICRSILQEHASDQGANEQLAWVLYKQHRLGEAIMFYKKYKAKEQNTAKANWYLLQYYLCGGEKYRPEAEALLDQVLKNPGTEYQEKARALSVQLRRKYPVEKK